MSSLFLGGAVFICVGVCFCFASEDIRLFAFHLFSYNLRIVDRPEDVLMTVRARARTAWAKKKRMERIFAKEFQLKSLFRWIVSVLAKKDLAYFQIQKIVFHLSILLQRLIITDSGRTVLQSF